MSIVTRAMSGAAWTAVSGWAQALVSLVAFGFVAATLSPSEIGAFGIAMLAIGFAELVFAAPLAEALQQRESLRRAHVTSTFWVSLALACSVATGLVLGSGPLASLFETPLAAPLVSWMALALPLSAATSVAHAMLARRMQFDRISQLSAVATCLSGLTTVVSLIVGLNIWALVVGDITGRSVKLLGFWWLSKLTIGRPTQLGAFSELARFNTDTVATYLLGYLDNAAPRALTGLLLGSSALGYYVVAERVLDMLSRLVLTPLASVAMAATARVQSDPEELKRLVMSLYRMAAIIGYPAFIGAALIVPDIARLFGDKWLGAVIAAQLLLLVGLRTTTGIFNISILRGLGRSRDPLLLLGSGFALQLAMIPAAASAWGVTGVAGAMLVRTLLTWPLGLWLVKRATALKIWRQAIVGFQAFAASLFMTGIVVAVLEATPALQPTSRIALGIFAGGAGYLAIMGLVHRGAVVDAARMLHLGDLSGALRCIARGIRVGSHA